MSLEINGRRFMNLQEAVAWLLQNNALPFQSTANYAPNTEIAKTTIINPSPAEIKVGALVLFADSKVGTVSGITTNGFMVGAEYTDIKNALAYIVNVAINNSNHLITTLSDGTTKDAGLIREVSSMSINGSQHLIVNYNDGTSDDLGAIFSGNVNIAGNLTADSIIENMSGYSFELINTTGYNKTLVYAGAVKNGNKLTIVIALKVTRTSAGTSLYCALGNLRVPLSVYNALYPVTIGGTDILDSRKIVAVESATQNVDLTAMCIKDASPGKLYLSSYNAFTSLEEDTEYYIRYELTFLLSNTLPTP